MAGTRFFWDVPALFLCMFFCPFPKPFHLYMQKNGGFQNPATFIRDLFRGEQVTSLCVINRSRMEAGLRWAFSPFLQLIPMH